MNEIFITRLIMLLENDLSVEQLRTVKERVSILLMEYDISDHRDLPSTDIINTQYIVKHFLATKKMKGLSDRTIETYTYHLKFFFERYSQVDIKEITTNHIRTHLAQLGRKCSMSYVDDSRRILNVFFKFCQNEEYISKNPVDRVEKIKVHKVIEKPYTDTEVEMLREACKNSRELAMVDFLLSTGVRRDEMCQIRLTDVDFDDRSVYIHGKGGKDRYVYFSERAKLHLLRYMDEFPVGLYLFGTVVGEPHKISHDGLAFLIKNIGKRAKVKNVHLHRFRKWFATHMVNSGVSIQELKEVMGHSKIDTTDTYYAFVQKEQIKNTIKRHTF